MRTGSLATRPNVSPLGYTLIVVSFLLSLLPGCGSSGGGTSGTGGSGFGISGVLRTAQNVPVPGVAVSVNPDGSLIARVSLSTNGANKALTEDATDENGAFQLELDTRPDMFVLRFQGNNFDSTVNVNAVPGKAAQVNVDVLFDDRTQSVLSDSEQFEDEEGNEITEEPGEDSSSEESS